jgi:DamX protein
VPVAKSAPDNGAFSADERALLALPSQQVVLQLIGAESRATIDKFAANAGQDVKLYVYGTRLRGKPWYIAVTGPYADRNTAAAAIAKLPEVLRKQQPWPRGVAAIQSDIKAHNGHY